jgi:hypothetical protein
MPGAGVIMREEEMVVDRSSIGDFHDQAIQSAVSVVEELRRILSQAHVPHNAYTLTDAGRAAQRGHTEHVTRLDHLLAAAGERLEGSARRTRASVGNYAGAELLATGQVQAIQA